MFQVAIGRVMGNGNTGDVKFDTGTGIVPVSELTVAIEGCPYNGIEAVDFRRANALPASPHNKIDLSPFVWIDEAFVRQLLTGDYRESNCDFRMEFERSYLWACNAMGEIYQSQFANHAVIEPAAISAYLIAYTSGDKDVIAAAGRGLVLNALSAKDRSKWKAEAERERKRPEIEERERAAAALKAQQDREAAEKKALKEAGEKALREWADAHGSDLLKARIEDGFEWLGLAEREYANSIVADLGEEVESPSEELKVNERSTPTLEEINRLRAIRKALSGKPATAELKWMEYSIEEAVDYDYTTDKVKQAEIEVTVTCPTGREIRFYYACPAAVEK